MEIAFISEAISGFISSTKIEVYLNFTWKDALLYKAMVLYSRFVHVQIPDFLFYFIQVN